METNVDIEGPIDTGGLVEMRVARAVNEVGGHMSLLVASTEIMEDKSLLRLPVMKGCLIAVRGFSRLSGSQIRHLAIKSTKSASSHRNTALSVLVPGRLRRPFEFTTGRGAPEESVDTLGRGLI